MMEIIQFQGVVPPGIVNVEVIPTAARGKGVTLGSALAKRSWKELPSLELPPALPVEP